MQLKDISVLVTGGGSGLGAATARAMAAKGAKVAVIDMIKDGTMICTGGDSPAADIGRKFTKRTDPF